MPTTNSEDGESSISITHLSIEYLGITKIEGEAFWNPNSDMDTDYTNDLKAL